jgi:hypothetical protein
VVISNRFGRVWLHFITWLILRLPLRFPTENNDCLIKMNYYNPSNSKIGLLASSYSSLACLTLSSFGDEFVA